MPEDPMDAQLETNYEQLPACSVVRCGRQSDVREFLFNHRKDAKMCVPPDNGGGSSTSYTEIDGTHNASIAKY